MAVAHVILTGVDCFQRSLWRSETGIREGHLCQVRHQGHLKEKVHPRREESDCKYWYPLCPVSFLEGFRLFFIIIC